MTKTRLRDFLEEAAKEVGFRPEAWNSFKMQTPSGEIKTCSVGDFVIAVIGTYVLKSNENAEETAKELNLVAVVSSKMDEKGNITSTAKVVRGHFGEN